MSISRWMVKEDVVHVYKGILLHRTKGWNNVTCSNIDATRLSEVSQRKTNAIKYHLYVESKIKHKWTYLWNRNKIRNTENRRLVAKVEGSRREVDWESRVSSCKVVYTEWIKDKILLYSKGKYIQYPMITTMEKYEKEWRYM